MRIPQKLAAAALGIAALLLVSGSANAAAILGTTDNVTGVSGLTVDGTIYDVGFAFKSYRDVFGVAEPFFSDQALALDAMTTLNDFLESQGVTGVVGLPTPRGTLILNLATGTLFAGPCFGPGPVCSAEVESQLSGTNWHIFDAGFNGGLSIDQTFDFNVQVIFSPAAASVPEPLSISLFGAGLAGAIAMRRRKRKA
jgi:hypothetical protein